MTPPPDIAWTEREQLALETLLALAKAEDVGPGDLTSAALVPEHSTGRAHVVCRQPGVVAGLPTLPAILAAFSDDLAAELHAADGQAVAHGTRLATIVGPAQAMLTAERTLLNFLTRLSGVASLTNQFVRAVAGTAAGIYDTRKTLPGYRLLDKYAVRAGGGFNQRQGLFDGVIIKDNHLAFGRNTPGAQAFSLSQAVARARQFCNAGVTIQIEVDTLEQLREVLPAGPDMVLLDNMPPAELARAVAIRNELAPGVVLEASGGVNLQTVKAIAASGVERISIGALTHSAPALDLALDWEDA